MFLLVYYACNCLLRCEKVICSQLCNWMFILPMQSCSYKYICCSVERAKRCCVVWANCIAYGLTHVTRLWWFHQLLTIVYQQAFAHNTHWLLEGIVCVLIGLLTQFWLLTCLPGITHTLLGPCICVILANRKQFISLNCMPYITHICI
jgi:hypothetical protein